jgi:diguanylate cyclase (GGDEF)-like protein
MIDIDHFKHINDSYGHQEGDMALKGIAELLRRRFRQSDIVARHGGEEFCVVVADSNLAHAKVLFEELRAVIEAHDFVLGTTHQQLTVSIGLAGSHEDDSEDLAALIARADARLYQAKKEGRNRLVGA